MNTELNEATGLTKSQVRVLVSLQVLHIKGMLKRKMYFFNMHGTPMYRETDTKYLVYSLGLSICSSLHSLHTLATDFPHWQNDFIIEPYLKLSAINNSIDICKLS